MTSIRSTARMGIISSSMKYVEPVLNDTGCPSIMILRVWLHPRTELTPRMLMLEIRPSSQMARPGTLRSASATERYPRSRICWWLITVMIAGDSLSFCLIFVAVRTSTF